MKLRHLLNATVRNVRARPSLSPLILVTGMTKAAAQRLTGACAIFARLSWLDWNYNATCFECSQASIRSHVTTATKALNVSSGVVSRIAVSVVAIYRWLAAHLTPAERISALRPRPLRFRARFVTLPRRMRFASGRADMTQVNTKDRAIMACSSFILVTRRADSSFWSGLIRLPAVLTHSHVRMVQHTGCHIKQKLITREEAMARLDELLGYELLTLNKTKA